MKTYIKQITILLLSISFSFFSCDGGDDSNNNNENPIVEVPTLTSFSPTSGSKETIVTINGTNFGDINTLQVFFNEVEAVIQFSTATEIKVIVPTGANTGLIKVISNNTELIGEAFTYIISDTQVSTLLVNSPFIKPTGIALDLEGTLYVTDEHKIKKIKPNGEVSILAGIETLGFEDGIGANAQFHNPKGIVADSLGNIYVVDTNNHKIRKIKPNGEVSTLAGSSLGFEDGIGANAQFNYPYGITIDIEGNLYIADWGNHRVRKITPSGEVTTFAGSTAGFVDAIGTNAKFDHLRGIAIDSKGILYVIDTDNFKIRKITPDGDVSTFVGSSGGFLDGIGEIAQFSSLVDITIDTQDVLYVTDFLNQKIRKITPSGEVTTIAGTSLGFEDGPGTSAQFNYPNGIVVDRDGTVYIADTSNRKIRKITQE